MPTNYGPVNRRSRRSRSRRKIGRRLLLLLVFVCLAALAVHKLEGKSNPQPAKAAANENAKTTGISLPILGKIGSKASAKPVSLHLQPSFFTLPSHLEQGKVPQVRILHVQAAYPDGSVQTLKPGKTDGGITFDVSNPQVAAVSPNGTVTVKPGAVTGDTAVITVHDGSITASSKVEVLYSLKDTVKPAADGTMVVTNPTDLVALIDKHRSLPADYIPPDLVVPNVRFDFKNVIEKKHLRKPAARALEQLFAAAQRDGITLYGVSGYRSYATQKAIFAANVKREGLKEASRVSAHPGTSEHQSGLAIDVAGASAPYSLEQTFGASKEGIWLAAHCADYGFIIRYPKGKESITGYEYEPWHIRFVGKTVAEDIMKKGITLEEYFQQTLAVASQK